MSEDTKKAQEQVRRQQIIKNLFELNDVQAYRNYTIISSLEKVELHIQILEQTISVKDFSLDELGRELGQLRNVIRSAERSWARLQGSLDDTQQRRIKEYSDKIELLLQEYNICMDAMEEELKKPETDYRLLKCQVREIIKRFDVWKKYYESLVKE